MTDIGRQRADVVAEAQRWLGTPYHPCARKRGVGVDCAQLPAAVYGALGLIPEVPVEDYPPDWHIHNGDERYLEEVFKHAVELPAPPAPGGFIMWKVGRAYAHGGIVIDYPLVIHAVAGHGVVWGDASRDCLGAKHRLADLSPRYFDLKIWGV